jgi:hypothetical protein
VPGARGHRTGGLTGLTHPPACPFFNQVVFVTAHSKPQGAMIQGESATCLATCLETFTRAISRTVYRLRRRQRSKQPLLNEDAEVARHAGRQRRVANQQAELDVSIHRGLSQIRRRHEHRFVVDDKRLGV